MKLTPEQVSNNYKSNCGYRRKGHVIYNTSDNSIASEHESINAAKRESRKQYKGNIYVVPHK